MVKLKCPREQEHREASWDSRCCCIDMEMDSPEFLTMEARFSSPSLPNDDAGGLSVDFTNRKKMLPEE